MGRALLRPEFHLDRRSAGGRLGSDGDGQATVAGAERPRPGIPATTSPPAEFRR